MNAKNFIKQLLFIKVLLLFLTLSFTVELLAQNSEKEKEELFTTIAPRVGFGVHNGFHFEAGLSVLHISNIALQWGAASLYTTYFVSQDDFNSGLNINGFKIGVQSSYAIFMWGLEVKTGSYNNNMFTYFSPKFGLSWLDVVNVEYLINIASKSDDFPWKSNHQIGVNISLNKKIYNNIWKK